MKKIIILLSILFATNNIISQNTMGTRPDSSRILLGNFSQMWLWQMKDSIPATGQQSYWSINHKNIKFRSLQFILPHDNDSINNFQLSNSAGYIYSTKIDSLRNFKNIRDSISNRYTKTQINNLLSSYLTNTYVSTWSNITGKPSFATVATTGTYTDLIGLPSIIAPVNADWNSSTGLSQIFNKPVLFSGAYTDLTGKPTLFSGAYSDLTGKPSLFSGSYIDLTNKPTIPSETSLTPGTNVNILGSGPTYTISSTPSLNLASGILSITGSNSITLPTSASQSITLSGNTLSVTSGGSVSLSGYSNPNYYNLSGTVTAITKVMQFTVSPSTANGYSINISAASFSSISTVQITAEKNSGSASACPNASIKSKSTSQIVVNVIEGNSAALVNVPLIGINVLSGVPSIFADVTGLILHIRIEGN